MDNNTFGIHAQLAAKVMQAALHSGGNYCDLYFEHRQSSYIGLQDKIVNNANSSEDLGMGVRVLNGDKTGFAFTESLTEESMLEAAKLAAGIANGKVSATVQAIQAAQPHPNYYPSKKAWSEISVDAKVPILQKLNDQLFESDPRIIKANIFLSEEHSEVLFVNSEGKHFTDQRPLASLGIVLVMQEGNRKESSYTSRSLRQGFEFISAEMLDALCQEAIDSCSFLFQAVVPKGGEMPVVLEAGGSGILLHEAIGHTFEADFNRKGESIFSDKMDQQVCADFVNVVDDGTNLANRGSLNIDDEGNATEKTYLVKNGILSSYLHDRLSAAHYQLPPTGNGRRESFRHKPMPRMRNTYMENGPHKKEELIASVEKGIYVNSFSNGEVNIGAGDFTFYVKSGYLIENGKLTQPIKDVNLIGNGPQALAAISMVADDLKFDNSTWSCGKSGQSVPVGIGMPSVKVNKLTVGGR